MRLQRVSRTAREGIPALQTAGTRPLIAVSSASSSRLSHRDAFSTTTSLPSRKEHLPFNKCTVSPVYSHRRSYASSLQASEPLKKTSLYGLHIARGAKMVPFGGFHMPVQYADLSVSASHHFTREKASLFDVGHMVQHFFRGPGATAFLQRITPASLAKLPEHQSTLSTLLWPETGGIVDDTVISKLPHHVFYVVTNAACRDKDMAYLREQLEKWRHDGREEVTHELLEGQGLIALQGPLAEEILSEILVEPQEAKLRELYFGQSRFINVRAGADGRELSQPLLVSRGGYTGEDGFEISVSPEDTVAVVQALFHAAGSDRLQLAGLGARDSLRLEAGMCLYGHDLDDTTTPVEAALSWVVGKDRRGDPTSSDAFHGADVVLKQLVPKSKGGQGVERRRVGLVIDGAPAREGAEIYESKGDQKIGIVTSGCPSPTLGKNIAMGYVKDGLHKAGVEVDVVVRGRRRSAVVTKMPFVPTKYWKGTAPS